MTMWGADPEELDSLGSTFGQAATMLEDIGSALRAALGSTSWMGSDAEAFQSDWQHIHSPMVNSVTGSLRDLAAKLGMEASQQRQASSDDGARGGASVGGSSGVARLVGDVRKLTASHSGTVTRGGTRGSVVTVPTQGTIDGVQYRGSLSAYEEGHSVATASGAMSLSHGLTGSAAAGAGAISGVTISRMVGSSGFGASAQGSVDTTAEVNAEATGSLGLSGLRAGASAGAFVGDQVQGSVTEGLGPIGGTETAGVQDGIGATVHIDAQVTASDVQFSIGGSAALGVGVTGGVSIKVDPQQVAHDVEHVATSVENWL